jgi:hypothetical protein
MRQQVAQNTQYSKPHCKLPTFICWSQPTPNVRLQVDYLLDPYIRDGWLAQRIPSARFGKSCGLSLGWQPIIFGA